MSDKSTDFDDNYTDEDLGFEKKGGLKQTMANIPPAARWMMVVVVLVCIVAIVMFVKNMGGTPQGLQPQTQGKARVDVNINGFQVKKSDNSGLENTETGNKLNELRDQNLDVKRKQKDSFIEKLELRNEQRMALNLQNEQEELDRRGSSVVTMNSDVAAQRIAERQRINRENQAKLRNEIAQRQSNGNNRQASQGDVNQNGLYYFDSSGNLVINSMPISQADLMELQMTGRVLDDDELYDDQLSKAESELMDDFDLSEVGYIPGNPVMANNAADKKQSSSKGESSTRQAGNAGGYDYFTRGVDAVREEKQNMRDLHSRLTDSSQGQAEAGGGYGGYSSGGGVSSYDRSSDEDRLDIAPGEMFYSILDIGINTDEISPVRATVIQEGMLKGAVLLGMPAKIGDKAVIQFTTMALNKKSYSVDVVAVDPKTWRTAIADDVNHHRFSRYAGLIGAAALTGYAEALTSSRTVTRSDGSTETIQDRLPDSDDQALYAAGRVGEVLVPKMEAAFDRESTVRVFENRDVGIMFMSGMDL